VRRIAKTLTAQEWVTIDNSEEGERPFKELERVLRERWFCQISGGEVPEMGRRRIP